MSEVVTSDDINQYFFDSITSERDPGEPRRIVPEHYGEIKKTLNLKYNSKYSYFGLGHQLHKNGKTDDFELNFSIFEPKYIPHHIEIINIWFIHGGPVNSTEFFPIGNVLGVWFRLIFVDILGMGKSSSPHEFPWSLNLHADIILRFIESTTKSNGWDNLPRFVIGNDWGGGISQIIHTKEYFLHGVGIINAIALNNYWVTEIGSLVALAKMDFKVIDKFGKEKISDMFKLQATSFVGGYTQLLKEMHDKTSRDLNQNTLQNFESDYIESKAYDDPKKTPFNTKVNYWKIRTLAEHASNLLGKGQLLPKSKTNPNGIDFTKLNKPILILHSNNDKMMPQQNVPKLKWILDKVILFQKSIKTHDRLKVVTGYIYDAGHFSTSDQPEQVAHHIIDFIDNIVGSHHKATDYLGVDILQRGDFKFMIKQSEKFKISNEKIQKI